MSIKLKAKGQDAKDLLGLKAERAGTRGAELMKENPASRQREGANKSEVSDITKVVAKTTVVPTPEASPVQGFDVVRPVNRDRKPDAPEAARQLNNRTRDMRTNLGRGKPGIVEIE